MREASLRREENMLVYYSYVENSNVVIVIFIKLQILYKLKLLACIFFFHQIKKSGI